MRKLNFVMCLLLMFTFVGYGCGIVCHTGSGNVVNETRTVSEFYRVEVEGSAEVYITVADEMSEEVRVEIDGNLLHYLDLRVSGQTLIVGTKECISTRSIRVYVTMNKIEKLAVSGSGEISVENTIKSDALALNISGSGEMNLEMEVNTLKTEVSGSGGVILAGKAETHNIEIAGSGEVNALELETDETNVEVSGSGDCQVWTTDLLTAEISGSGLVVYKGEPQVQSNISGSGSIKPSE